MDEKYLERNKIKKIITVFTVILIVCFVIGYIITFILNSRENKFLDYNYKRSFFETLQRYKFDLILLLVSSVLINIYIRLDKKEIKGMLLIPISIALFSLSSFIHYLANKDIFEFMKPWEHIALYLILLIVLAIIGVAYIISYFFTSKSAVIFKVFAVLLMLYVLSDEIYSMLNISLFDTKSDMGLYYTEIISYVIVRLSYVAIILITSMCIKHPDFARFKKLNKNSNETIDMLRVLQYKHDMEFITDEEFESQRNNILTSM